MIRAGAVCEVVAGAVFALHLALGLGAAYGLLLEVLAMQLIVNPARSPNLAYASLPGWAWWAGNVVYGSVLGLLANRRLAA